MNLINIHLQRNSATINHSLVFSSPITWESKLIELIELIYALYSYGVFGKAHLFEVFLLFEKIFNIRINNYSHSLGRIKVRPNDRCTFLSKLIRNLECYMDKNIK
ncbi:MAG: RteC domain-containing protein [Rikenellaceae bacterium]